MQRTRQPRSVFGALALVGVVGAGISYAFGIHALFTAFCGAVGVGGIVVLRGGERYVAPITLSLGVFAAFLAVVYVARYDQLLGVLFAVVSLAAFARTRQYRRAYST
ncbi:hypothetical protein [Halococcus agarilyticus]|uniref:hypothetical protein n=1 Tax=Halococcus agarilyticus TaxID=1232219 RepID=UPI0006779346|nr:hypothetical protein [Halococcus agarilyticus]